MMDPKLLGELVGFRYAIRRFLVFCELATRDAGVTPQQYQALLIIHTHSLDGIAVKDLADQLLLKHHTVVEMVDRMSQVGLVTRAAAPDDARSVLVQLTDTGMTALETLTEKHLSELMEQEYLLANSLKQLKKLHKTEI